MSATTSGTAGGGYATSARRLVGAGALAVVAVLAATSAGTWTPPISDAAPEAPPASPVLPRVESPEQDPVITHLDRLDVSAVDLRWLWVGLGVVLGSLLVFWLVRLLPRYLPFLRRRRGEEPEGGPVVHGPIVMPSIATLHAGVTSAERRLRSHARPVDAVIAAWVTLEKAAEESGVAREVAATPTEFTVDVLDRTPADPAATRTLLDLYLRARFGDEGVGPAEVDQAEGALRTLTRTLTPPPSRDDDAPPAPAQDDTGAATQAGTP